MKLLLNRNQRRSIGAFTLIELLVVLVIIAALAALIVPNIGMFGRSADMAVSAKTQADLAQQVQLFFVTQKRYPQGLDSLITSGGTPAIYAADSTSGDTQTIGLPISGADGVKLQEVLRVTALSGEELRSLTRAGFDWVWDHDNAELNSNTSNTSFRALVDNIVSPGIPGTATAPTKNVAELSDATGAVTTPAAATKLIRKLVPQGLKSNEKIVAFGFGQKNSALGKTTTTVPLYPGADKTYYGRYILYFKIYASGERATLVGVSDSYGRTPDYTQQQFNESMPDGARQG
ncbi:MAG: prepilin-type N-terminal cleavage/methylation domain-containing protein [Verrucomicrobiaceae bacterium]|nr:MAG: prepilin-type N-terminal cleavage/methylation domain-containing protein [Verrucomicrobiaceae bacterium]